MKKIYALFGCSLLFLIGLFVNANNEISADVLDAYNWAYQYGITTLPVENARLDEPITRQAAAKMIVNFSMKALGKMPDYSKRCVFSDQDIVEDLVPYVEKACQLGAMGQETSSFNPYGNLTTAQFGTILSRLLWGDSYDGASPYYAGHLRALQSVGILRDYYNPTETFETRGNIMVMLKRAYVYRINEKEFGLSPIGTSSSNSNTVTKDSSSNIFQSSTRSTYSKEDRMVLCTDSKGDLTLDRGTSQWVYKYRDGSGLNIVCSNMDNSFSCKNDSGVILNPENSGFVCEDDYVAASVTPKGFAVIKKADADKIRMQNPVRSEYVGSGLDLDSSIDLTSLFTSTNSTGVAYSGLVDEIMKLSKDNNSHLYQLLQLEKEYNKAIETGLSGSIEDYLGSDDFLDSEDAQKVLELLNNAKEFVLSTDKLYKESLEKLKKDLNSNDKKFELEERIEATLENIELTDNYVNSMMEILLPMYEVAVKYGTGELPEEVEEQIMGNAFGFIGVSMGYSLKVKMYSAYLDEWGNKVYKELTGKEASSSNTTTSTSTKADKKTENSELQFYTYDAKKDNNTTVKTENTNTVFYTTTTNTTNTNTTNTSNLSWIEKETNGYKGDIIYAKDLKDKSKDGRYYAKRKITKRTIFIDEENNYLLKIGPNYVNTELEVRFDDIEEVGAIYLRNSSDTILIDLNVRERNECKTMDYVNESVWNASDERVITDYSRYRDREDVQLVTNVKSGRTLDQLLSNNHCVCDKTFGCK